MRQEYSLTQMLRESDAIGKAQFTDKTSVRNCIDHCQIL